jgi:hypothetical protein
MQHDQFQHDIRQPLAEDETLVLGKPVHAIPNPLARSAKLFSPVRTEVRRPSQNASYTARV